eukprot:CAMPEP_0174316010 /NCGR_PEP_ID=MMETSP0810-20121108/6650_1 /TAXON_ID=73025 ORGANISM="Eutreptiella gymnastica-like, Strain CCMP1594" /NCGR_SAMPLE_ID=MMETSP0810 /ASSEMBLY_ACC=CAM_ASM_000659 /LENGTH=106 /DNA_ID=CAMNT_0015425551 /DNA_START=635 /DNA_END=951 /DNA_ORIENTATION=-
MRPPPSVLPWGPAGAECHNGVNAIRSGQPATCTATFGPIQELGIAVAVAVCNCPGTPTLGMPLLGPEHTLRQLGVSNVTIYHPLRTSYKQAVENHPWKQAGRKKGW